MKGQNNKNSPEHERLGGTRRLSSASSSLKKHIVKYVTRILGKLKHGLQLVRAQRNVELQADGRFAFHCYEK